jgi:quercetin dioxygenase-like cupin family protein
MSGTIIAPQRSNNWLGASDHIDERRDCMTSRFTLAALAICAAAGMAAAPLQAQEHVMLTPDEIEWQAGPASIPDGAEAVVLYGDPSTEGPFALRLKLPEGYHIPPHTHPRPEIVTVISGTFHLGTGETADRDAAEALPTGSFFAFDPGMAHFAYNDEETVIQLTSVGPWSLDYVNPDDDPRGTQ